MMTTKRSKLEIAVEDAVRDYKRKAALDAGSIETLVAYALMARLVLTLGGRRGRM